MKIINVCLLQKAKNPLAIWCLIKTNDHLICYNNTDYSNTVLRKDPNLISVIQNIQNYEFPQK